MGVLVVTTTVVYFPFYHYGCTICGSPRVSEMSVLLPSTLKPIPRMVSSSDVEVLHGFTRTSTPEVPRNRFVPCCTHHVETPPYSRNGGGSGHTTPSKRSRSHSDLSYLVWSGPYLRLVVVEVFRSQPNSVSPWEVGVVVCRCEVVSNFVPFLSL